jgi:hypothetical protein
MSSEMFLCVVWQIVIDFLRCVMMTEAAGTAETSDNIDQTTRRNIQDGHFHTRCHENLKSHTRNFCLIIKSCRPICLEILRSHIRYSCSVCINEIYRKENGYLLASKAKYSCVQLRTDTLIKTDCSFFHMDYKLQLFTTDEKCCVFSVCTPNTWNSATMSCFNNKKKRLRGALSLLCERYCISGVSHDPASPDDVTQAVYTQMKV